MTMIGKVLIGAANYWLLAGLALLVSAGPANGASLTLTQAGIDAGFVLTTFATINPGYANTSNFGPFGVAVTGNGNVLVSNYANNVRYVFADMDGQTVASALASVPNSGSSTVAYTTAGGLAYGGVNGRFVQFNNDGTVNHILTRVTPATFLGMAGNSADGHILASSSAGLIDIDPLANSGAGSYRVVNGDGNGDGVSVSIDGKIVYSEQGTVNGYDIATGDRVYTSPNLFPSPDGTGVISSKGSLNGQIIVNNNNGEVDLLDPVLGKSVAIATGGTRGDYVTPDPNGTLFLDYSDIVARLSCGPDCSIGTPLTDVTPEPSSGALLGLALTGGAVLLRFRRRRTY